MWYKYSQTSSCCGRTSTVSTVPCGLPLGLKGLHFGDELCKKMNMTPLHVDFTERTIVQK